MSLIGKKKSFHMFLDLKNERKHNFFFQLNSTEQATF